MPALLVTFKPGQTHEISGVLFDAQCVAVVRSGSLGDVKKCFGNEYSRVYTDKQFDSVDSSGYSRGYVPVTSEMLKEIAK